MLFFTKWNRQIHCFWKAPQKHNLKVWTESTYCLEVSIRILISFLPYLCLDRCIVLFVHNISSVRLSGSSRCFEWSDLWLPGVNQRMWLIDICYRRTSTYVWTQAYPCSDVKTQLFCHFEDEDQRNDAISCLISTVRKGFNINQLIKFEVFIHKVDGFSDERKMEIHHEIQQQISELLLQDGNESIIQKIFLK